MRRTHQGRNTVIPTRETTSTAYDAAYSWPKRRHAQEKMKEKTTSAAYDTAYSWPKRRHAQEKMGGEGELRKSEASLLGFLYPTNHSKTSTVSQVEKSRVILFWCAGRPVGINIKVSPKISSKSLAICSVAFISVSSPRRSTSSSVFPRYVTHNSDACVETELSGEQGSMLALRSISNLR